MNDISAEIKERILALVEPRQVLEYLDYCVESIQETDAVFRCLCPIHRERVLRTMTVDKRTSKIRCSFAQCPGKSGGDLVDLVALAKKISVSEAVADLAQHFDIRMPAQKTYSAVIPPTEPESPLVSPVPKAVSAPSNSSSIKKDAFAQAYDDFRAALKEQPDNLESLEGMVDLCRKENRQDLLFDALHQLGGAALSKGIFPRAALAYRELVTHRPNEVTVRLLYAESLEKMQRYEEAVQEMMEATLLLRKEDRVEEALELCRKMKILVPDSEAVFSCYVQLLVDIEYFEKAGEELVERAAIWMTKGQPDSALKCYRRILDIDPRYDDIRMKYIEIAVSTQSDESILNQALRMVDGFVEKEMALLALNNLRINSNRFPDVVPILEKAFHLYHKLGYASESDETALDLAEAYIAAGNTSGALECLLSLTPTAGDPTVVLSRKARLLETMGHKREAAQALLQIIEYYDQVGQIEKAVPLHEIAIQLDSSNLRIYVSWFRYLSASDDSGVLLSEGEKLLPILERHSDRETAEQILSILVNHAPERVDFLLAQADLLLKKNQPLQAQGLLLRSAELLAAQKDYERAVQALQCLLRRDPQNLAATELLADCRVQQGSRAQALLSYQSLAEMYAQWKQPEKQLGIFLKIAAVSPSDLRTLQQIHALYEQLNLAAEALEIRRKLATLYFERKAYPKALELCQAILAKNASDALASEQILNIYSAMRRPDLLRKDGLAFLDLAQTSGDTDAFYRILQILIENFQTEEAITDRLLECLRADDQRSRALPLFQRLIDACMESARFIDAIGFMKRALTLDISPDCLFPLWMQMLERPLIIQSNWVQVESFLDFLQEQKHQDFAAQTQAGLAEIEPGFEPLLARIRKDDNQQAPSESEQTAETDAVADRIDEGKISAFALDAGSSDATSQQYLEQANLLVDSEQYVEACSILREGLSISPNDLVLRSNLASLLQSIDLKAEAIDEMAAICMILIERGEFPKALESVQEIQALDPENLRAKTLRAEIHVRMGEKDLALAEFRSMAAQVGSGSVRKVSNSIHSLKEPLPLMEMLPVKSEYSFDQFIVGSNNNFAHATSLAIAKSPGDEFNPLFLYGDVGLGKTHLLHAIANYLKHTRPELQLLYTSSREFTSGLIDAIQNNTIREFRALHKSADFLMIDDIQFLSDQERAQEEFFQIFNTLYQSNRQIVLTSDRPPREIAHLEMRLRSRFGSGITVDIQSPDLETRIAILRRDAQHSGLPIDGEILAAIAQNIDSNIRDLKAALNQITARFRIAKEPPSPEMAAQIVEVIVGQSRNGTNG